TVSHTPLQHWPSWLQAPLDAVQHTPLAQPPLPHWLADVQVCPLARPVQWTPQVPGLQHCAFEVQAVVGPPHVADWQMFPMQASPGAQQVAPAAQGKPEPMQLEAAQVPPTQAAPVAAQQLFPHGTWPCVHAATAVAHVEVDGLAHAVPVLQQADPQGVVRTGHPHTPLAASRHAIPRWQQQGPHGVVPAAHGEGPTLVGPEHVTLALPRKGLSTVATAAPPAATPNILRTLRRLCGAPIALARSSNRSLMASSFLRGGSLHHLTWGCKVLYRPLTQHVMPDAELSVRRSIRHVYAAPVRTGLV